MKLVSIVMTILLSTRLCACAASSSTDLTTEQDQVVVTRLLSELDDRRLTVSEQLANYTDDAVILAPGQREIRGEDALRQHLSEFGVGVDITTRHDIVELASFEDIVVVQGRVGGTAQPDGDPNIYDFETKNIILFKRVEGSDLKIWKVIYNSAPTH